MRTLTPAALILWLVLVCIGLLADAGSTRAAPAYSVVFSGSQTITVTPGETFTATLLLDLDGESSIQQGVSLTFDEELQDLLDIVSITPLGVPPYNFTIEPSPVDSVLGAAGTITGFLSFAIAPITADEPFAIGQVEFRPKTPGTTSIRPFFFGPHEVCFIYRTLFRTSHS